MEFAYALPVIKRNTQTSTYSKMPLIKPNNTESQNEFISRCMGDEVIQKDFKDQKQRLAVCFSQWKTKDDKEESKGFKVFVAE